MFLCKKVGTFLVCKKIINRIKLKTDADFILWIFMVKCSEKMALGHFLDGKITGLVEPIPMCPSVQKF